jgi:hypothetical protein
VSADLGSFLSLSCNVTGSTAIMELCVDGGVQQFQGMYDVSICILIIVCLFDGV